MHPTFLTCSFLKDLSPQERQALWDLARPLPPTEKGGLLRCASDPALCGLLLEGRAQVTRLNDEGERPLTLLEAGDLWGLAEALLGVEDRAEVRALTACRAVNLSLDQWGRLSISLQAKIWKKAALGLALKNRGLAARVDQLSARSLREKIALLVKTLGPKALDQLNQREMSEWLACDRSALSRELNRMKKEGFSFE